jgi:RNA polymerase sigma factor (TIGR02999 family)
MVPDPDVTRLIRDLEGGDREAFDRLLAAIYPALREMARAQHRGQRPGHTLDPTALVHEAYLRMVRYQDVQWQGRAHFFGAAAQTMRRVLVDHARARSADRRRGEHVTLATGISNDDVSLERVLEIEDALRRLEKERPRWVRVVECRYFAGLTLEETAEALGVSHATVSNDWRLARAWLRKQLADAPADIRPRDPAE